MSSEGLHVPREKLSKKTLLQHYAITSLIEELEHAAMALEWLRRSDAEVDKNLREYLFKEGSITGHEEKATGKA